MVAEETSSCGKKKRKLVPLRAPLYGESQLLADFDPRERLTTPVCPYVEKSPRRSRRRKSSPSISSATCGTQSHANGRGDEAKKSKKGGGTNGESVDSAGTGVDAPQKPLPEPSTFGAGNGTTGENVPEPSKKWPDNTRSIVCTFMHRKDVDSVTEIVEKLGGWIVEPKVSSATTHVVCGEEKRTINLLRGIAYGCWILHWDWVTHSREAGQWICEEPYELQKFSGIKQCRLARKVTGYKNEIFKNGDVIFVAKNTSPPRSDLLNLLHLCSAKVVETVLEANVIVGSLKNQHLNSNSMVQVNEKWVLDSIQENKLQPKQQYLVP